jgi:hypothetical protein
MDTDSTRNVTVDEKRKLGYDSKKLYDKVKNRNHYVGRDGRNNNKSTRRF